MQSIIVVLKESKESLVSLPLHFDLVREDGLCVPATAASEVVR